MNLESLLKEKLIKETSVDKDQIGALVDSAQKDLEATNEIIKIGHYAIARDTAYQAMIKVGIALMNKHGYRPNAYAHHIAVVRFCENIVGGIDKRIIADFDRLRRNRHDRLYQGRELASKTEAKAALQTAMTLYKITTTKFLRKLLK